MNILIDKFCVYKMLFNVVAVLELFLYLILNQLRPNFPIRINLDIFVTEEEFFSLRCNLQMHYHKIRILSIGASNDF